MSCIVKLSTKYNWIVSFTSWPLWHPIPNRAGQPVRGSGVKIRSPVWVLEECLELWLRELPGVHFWTFCYIECLTAKTMNITKTRHCDWGQRKLGSTWIPGHVGYSVTRFGLKEISNITGHVLWFKAHYDQDGYNSQLVKKFYASFPENTLNFSWYQKKELTYFAWKKLMHCAPEFFRVSVIILSNCRRSLGVYKSLWIKTTDRSKKQNIRLKWQ